jgi:NADPH-dependent curcumin reductase
MADVNRQWLLASRPFGEIKDENFSFQESPIPKPGPGEVLVRNLYLSLDPAMRGWMNDADSYIEPVKIGDVMRGGTVGEVLESNVEGLSPGDKVMGLGGWQDYTVYKQPNLPRKLPAELGLPLTNFLSVLGITGLTAYFGLLDVADPKPGETVVVSTAAGAVGSVVGQIAKIKGCRVVGIAGADDKCKWIVDELGFDAAINYKTQDVAAELRKACPDKIDVYFDNVGGEILNTVLGMINVGARISICGAITVYNATKPQPGPSNYITLLTKRSKMQGFIVMDYADRFAEGLQQLGQWVLSGQIKFKEDVQEGLENAPRIIHRLFRGENTGKLIVHIADPKS